MEWTGVKVIPFAYLFLITAIADIVPGDVCLYYRNTPEFASFQRTYVEIWSSIVTVLGLLESFLTESQVSVNR